MEFPCECHSPEEMHDLGVKLAENLVPGAVVGLCGPLGAGKTQLVKGIAVGMGHGGAVTSPTFTLMHEYRGGREPLFHFDLYRVKQERELLELGWDELIDEGVVVAEWADRYPDLMPRDSLWLVIAPLESGGRRVSKGRG